MNRNDCRKMRGSVYSNNGYWCWEGRLPGELKRKKHPLCAPGSDHAMRDDRPKEMAIEAAHRLWEEATRQRRDAPTDARTVDELCDAFVRYAATYYKRGGESSSCACAVRMFREMFGSRPLGELVHTDMLAVRDALVRSGLARVTVNRYIGIITNRMMPWALDEGLVRAQVKAELSQVRPLKRNRSEARETAPIRPVGAEAIKAAQACMMPNTADMVEVHRLTGMRPAELCSMRWQDIDTSATPWIYRPRDHKNDWRGELGQPRVVLIGPRARAILERHRETEYPFSPVAATFERMVELRKRRTSPFYPCRDESYSRADPHATRKPRDHWDTCSYSRTIHAACLRAKIDPWSANRLRHVFATDVRRRFGLEATRAVLGHSMGARITDRYSFEAAEDEIIRAASEAVEALG